MICGFNFHASQYQMSIKEIKTKIFLIKINSFTLQIHSKVNQVGISFDYETRWPELNSTITYSIFTNYY